MRVRGAIGQKRGDWQWLKAAFGLTGWAPEGVMGRCCHRCFANNSTLPFTDPSLNALWRNRMFTHELFMQWQLAQGGYLSPVWNIPGLRHEHFSIDLMHTGELGILLYLYANICFEIFCSIGGLISKPGAALGDIMLMVKVASKAVGQKRPPINRLTLQMFYTSGKTLKMKIKAAESRYLLPCVKYILEYFMPMETPHDQLRYHCVRTIWQMYDLMRAPAAEFQGRVVATLARKHLLLYADLSKESIQSRIHQKHGRCFWKWAPKHHLFAHFEQQIATCGNPAEHWCYADESLIGEVAKVCEGCHPNTLHRLVIQKTRIVG